jgi:hypothetical protein
MPSAYAHSRAPKWCREGLAERAKLCLPGEGLPAFRQLGAAQSLLCLKDVVGYIYAAQEKWAYESGGTNYTSPVGVRTIHLQWGYELCISGGCTTGINL